MAGTRRDGTTHQMAGVIVFGVRDGRFAWARFHLEPVQAGSRTSTRQRASTSGPAPGPLPAPAGDRRRRGPSSARP